MKQNKKLRPGEELETGVPWFDYPDFDPERKVLNEQTQTGSRIRNWSSLV